MLTLGQTISAAEPVTLTVEVDCPDTETLYLYRFAGLLFEPLLQASVRDQKATFQIPAGDRQFFYLGKDTRDVLPILLGEEEEVRVTMNCRRLRRSEIHQSPLNQAYTTLRGKVMGLKGRVNAALKQHNSTLRAGTIPRALQVELVQIQSTMDDLLASTEAADPFFGEVVQLNTYLTALCDTTVALADELTHYATEYFGGVKNWESPSLYYQPWVYESFKAYATTLARAKMPADQLQQYINAQLARIPNTTPTYKLAFSGVLNGIEKGNPEAWVRYANLFADQYGDEHPELARQLQEKVKNMARLTGGAVAPDFTQNDPDR